MYKFKELHFKQGNHTIVIAEVCPGAIQTTLRFVLTYVSSMPIPAEKHKIELLYKGSTLRTETIHVVTDRLYVFAPEHASRVELKLPVTSPAGCFISYAIG